jgi:CysZ protein
LRDYTYILSPVKLTEKQQGLLKEIVIAVESYYKAHQFISRHRLWKWILIPGILYMLLFCVSIYFFGKSATAVIETLMIETGLQHWADKMESSWLGFLFTFAGIILWLLLMLLYFSLFKYLFLIIGSPLFAYLSERTEALLEGKTFAFSWAQLLKDMVRGIRLALRNTIWQTVYIISLLLLSFIPVAGWIVPVVTVLVECYYYGFSMLDYSCERHKLSASESIDYIGKHKGLAIGNGIVFYLMHMIPFLGWVLAPAYAVVAATISLYHRE